ncbi:nine-heme cytochrome c precursor [bacterium BMS3Abin07]|nr:nine-heme cytochrome c precursor [bacterium BMS3Abin07]
MRKITTIVLAISVCILFVVSPYSGKEPNTDTASATSSKISMPGVCILDSLTDLYEPVKFDHAMHTFIADNCGMCHHQHPDSEAQRCKNCHSLNASIFKKSVVNSFLSCKTCHGTYDPANPDMPGLKVAYHRQCFQCHRGMGNVGKDPRGCTKQCHAKRAQAGK